MSSTPLTWMTKWGGLYSNTRLVLFAGVQYPQRAPLDNAFGKKFPSALILGLISLFSM